VIELVPFLKSYVQVEAAIDPGSRGNGGRRLVHREPCARLAATTTWKGTCR